MSEIEHCKGIQNSCPNNFCEELNEELTALKRSVTACLYNILYNKLESRTKISTEDSRLIYPNHCKHIYSQKYYKYNLKNKIFSLFKIILIQWQS